MDVFSDIKQLVKNGPGPVIKPSPILDDLQKPKTKFETPAPESRQTEPTIKRPLLGSIDDFLDLAEDLPKLMDK